MHDFHGLRLFQPTRITNRWPRLRSGSHFNLCEINITHVLLRDKLTGFINVKICACGALELTFKALRGAAVWLNLEEER